MFERTAGCLESGSLRRLLPGPRNGLKSRRLLHSAFWNHGGGDIDLSLWASLMQNPESTDEPDEKGSKRSVSTSGLFLDFLYPFGTLNYLRQCTFWRSDRHDHRTRVGHVRLGQRLYTSLAAEERATLSDRRPGNYQDQSDVDDRCFRSSEHRSQDGNRTLPSKDVIGIERANDYEEAWRRFDLMDSAAQNDLIPNLLALLSLSPRGIDANRAVALFERISSDAGLQEHQAALHSYLSTGDVTGAVQLQQQIMTRFEEVTGSDILFAYLIDHADWESAFAIYADVQDFRNLHARKANFNVWKIADTLPNLQDRALELAASINDKSGTSSDTSAKKMSQLSMAVVLIQRAVLPKADPTVDSTKSLALLKILRHWNKDTAPFYERIIEKSCEASQAKLAVQCYRQYRRTSTHKIARKTLNKVLELACEQHDVVLVQMILDDWFRLYGQPSRLAYRLCMVEFAYQGDAKTVKALLDQYMQKLPARTPDDIAPLLHVHAKRGELTDVVELFENMETMYGVKPNVKSWNILINAYGKVRDVDGALKRFDQLLESNLQPDQYTIGTLMGICITRGDLAAAMDFYQMAESLGVPRSIAMVDCIVLGHIQDDHLQQAEKICEDALQLRLDGSVTRMWNYLLTTYAMLRDLENTNRVLRRMAEAEVEYDGSTYAALMQALAMVKQPERAWMILTKVLPKADIKITPFHYAVVMGGFLATGETHRVFEVHRRMIRHKFGQSVSTRLMILKAAVNEDMKVVHEDSSELELARAERIFRDAYNTRDPKEFSGSQKKGVINQSPDAAYNSAYFDFLIFVYGQHNSFQRVEELYNQYLQGIPTEQEIEPPIKILSALMTAKLKEKNYQSVQECWNLAFTQAKRQGQPIRSSEDRRQDKILPFHRLDLVLPLSRQITSLAQQHKYQQLASTIEEVQDAGFELDSENWNIYVQFLALASRYKQAFELCEEKLMAGWVGWARLRWRAPGRNRLPSQLRHHRKEPRFLRPKYHTLLFLAKALSDLEASVIESRNAQLLLKDLTNTCPRVIQAIRTMERTDSDLERDVLRE